MKAIDALLTLVLLFSTITVSAQQVGDHGEDVYQSGNPQLVEGARSAATQEPNAAIQDILALLRQQQQELTNQRQLLQRQAQQIATLTKELAVLKAPAAEQALPLTPETSAPDTVTTLALAQSSTAEQTAQEKASETGESVALAQADDPSRNTLEDFTGAWTLPGTDAALSIGGFVKTAIIYNYDPLQIRDRFIVGSIPVGKKNTAVEEAQSSITADQSRLNFDLRTPTDYGIMRAFIEGDFAGSNENFRLRHAFGQWNRMLAGKTWTTFMDPDASPEEIDFEGLNGRINVRQAQVRFMPVFGNAYELQLALEDPNPQIQNGSGVTKLPDIVLAGRFDFYKRFHMKLALLAREIRGQSTTGEVAKKFAWGTSLSGSVSTPRFDARDKMLFQLNAGNGIGRYVNDLSSIGSYDGIFDPKTNNLDLFDVFAGYVSWQHWWNINELRSNFTIGAVDVDSPGFMGGDSYKRTLRFSSNLIWSPMPRIDIAGEYLWGRRENKNGEDGDARQLQFAVKYQF